MRDEAAMLPRWIGYYGAQLGMENLVVVDDCSTDGSTDDLPCRVIRHSGFREGRFEKARMRLASRLGAELLRSHDAVIFTDADEFLLADPDRYDGLLDFVAARPELDVAAGLGLNVVHHLDHEGRLDPGEPVLGQRRFAKFVGTISKPSLKRIGAPWARASHGIRAPYVPDRGLLMVHLKFADLDLMRRTADLRHAVRVSSGLSERSTWAKSGDEIVAEYRSFLDGGPDVPEFDAQQVDPRRLVVESNGVWHTEGDRQLSVMAQGALLRVPSRYYGMV
ncbi:glycosyltransferase family 2 protein [Nocardioides sp.]|uniref:glycosyltransferase family 2 protein n=1 Tax=Nocardioides sp. TaxID=35761 RepID=UPI0039E48DDE